MPLSVLALVCARSGSKGLRHKNVRKLGGVPLLVRAVELARRSARRGERWSVVVSTDSPHYARLARRAGAGIVRRPASLAGDDARLIDAVLHTLDELESAGGQFDAVLLLSAATPLTEERDVREALGLFRRGGGVSVASVTRDRSAPSWRFELHGGVLDRRPRRHRVGQRPRAGREAVVLNGALYVASPAWLRRYRQFIQAGRTLASRMPVWRSVDIEDRDDLELAERLLGSRDTS